MLLHHALARAPGRARRKPGAARRTGSRPLGHRVDRCGRRDPAGGAARAIGWASSRPRQPSRPCTPTHSPPRSRLGADRASGTTSSPLTDSPVVRLNRQWQSAEADGWRAGAGAARWTIRCPATRRWRRISTSATATSRWRRAVQGEAALKAPNLAERDHLTRQAARLNARLHAP